MISPAKLCEVSAENKTPIDMLRANVRNSETFLGGLRAQ